MRIVYLGTPSEAIPPLRGLADAGHDVCLAVTQPDRRRARGAGTMPSPVKAAAVELGIPVLTPERSAEVVAQVRECEADLGVVVAFGQILPGALLEALPGGFVNLHLSLLPRWRGAAPVQRAILAGDFEAGVCVMRVVPALDAGPLYACERFAVEPAESTGELRGRLIEAGTQLLLAILPRMSEMVPTPQSGVATYAEKVTVQELRLDPSRPSEELARLVRAGCPAPGAWFRSGGTRLKVLRARVLAAGPDPGVVVLAGGAAVLGTGEGGLELDQVQPEGRHQMSGAAWLAGRRAPLEIDPMADGDGG